MKAKTKAFADEILAHPKLSNTEAYMRTHQTINRRSASVSAARLLATPSVSAYLDEHVNSARKRIVQLVDGAGKEEIQLRAAQDILDRSYGKARQGAGGVTKGISINIDLTSPQEGEAA